MMFSTWGALAGLVLAIVLIVRKVTPAYALVFGALAGGLLGGGGLQETVKAMISGTQSMMPSVLRILTSGVLVGALVKTGAAEKIADSVMRIFGSRFALAAVAFSAMVVTAVGVFVDIAVITVAPVALAMGRKAGLPVSSLLVAMVGGGKAGNVISPNPNTIAVADAFKCDLTSVMAANWIPAVCSLAMTVALSSWLARRDRFKRPEASIEIQEGASSSLSSLPPVWAAFAGPLTVVALLALRPVAGFAIDPLVALPAGGIVSVLACGKWRRMVEYSEYGMGRVLGVSVLLIGTGAVAGVVKASGLNTDMIAALNALKMPAFALAPLSSFLLSGATASTTAGVTIAGQTFSETLLQSGIPALSAAAMLHAGGTIIDALPHGSFFHATAGAVGMSVKERLRLFPYGTLVGLTSAVTSVIVYLLGI